MIGCSTTRRSGPLVWFPMLLLFPALVHGEEKSPVTLRGESRAVVIRLAEARKRLENQKWSEAIEELQAILKTAGNDLVPISPMQSVRAGRLCQVQLASLPANALRLYRQRYENQAGKKLQQAQAEHDVAQLRKLVEDSFCTRAAEKALDLLGDLAFERGRFAEAEEWWRLLAPLPQRGQEMRPPRSPAPPEYATLVYPDPSLDVARIQAKQLLARLFHRADTEWAEALEAFRDRHGRAEGTLAGRKGSYVDVLAALAETKAKQGPSERDDWRTFGGDPSRGRVISASEDILDQLSALCREGPTWTFDLEKRAPAKDAAPAPAVDAAQARSLAFYPVIVGHQVLVADARYVTAFDIRNGHSEKWYDVKANNGGVSPQEKLPAPPDLRYTLAVSGDHVYARLGAQDIGFEETAPQPNLGPAKPPRDQETFLACLGLRPNPQGGHFRWHIRGMAHDSSLLEGAPLVGAGQIWIASTRYRGGRCLTAIDSYPTEDSSEPPLRWHCDVCETSEIRTGEPRYRHHLLTQAGTQIVYCSHTGAIIAVDALTGRRNWAIRYSRRMSETEEVDLRDLNPVLFAAGRLYVAPADSDSLLCLDPATGRTLWELEALRVVHLLGVGQGRLLFTTPKGLRAVRADDGNPVWAVPDSGTLTPAGRGLLIGDLVLFPTTQQRDLLSPSESVVYALRQRDGRPVDDPARLHRLPAGNLAYSNGCLAVADRQTLFVFAPPRLLLETRRQAVQHAPDSVRRLLHLARAQADAGQEQAALRTLRSVEQCLEREPHLLVRKTLRTQALATQQQVLLALAQRASQVKNWQDAEQALEQAGELPLAPRYRLQGLLRAAQIWHDAGETNRATAVRKTILADATLRDIQIRDREGKPASVSSALRQSDLRGRVSAPSASSRGADANPLALPLVRAWHVQLAADEWILAGWQEWDAELLLTGSPDGRFRCRLTATGDMRWQHRLPFAPRWAGCAANSLLVGGEAGVACLRRDNGALLWHFPAPLADRYPHALPAVCHVVLEPQPLEPLTDFRFVGGRLFFLQGQRRLFALDSATGSVLWDRWAPDGAMRLPPPRSCFSPCYYAGAQTVLVQASGHRWLLDAATGRPLDESVDGRNLWQRPPLQLDEHTLCVTPDARQVLLLDARTGKCLWTHRAAGGSTLQGEIPSMLGRGEVLLYVQPTNIGYFLHRLDRATGKPLWPRPQLLAARTLKLSDWSFDTAALYGIESGFLSARSLAEGKVLWRRPLPAGAIWQVQRSGDYLAVLPWESASEGGFQYRSPLGAVQWNVGRLLLPDALSPLSWYDPKTGQLVQRLNFRIEAPPRTALEIRTISQEDAPARIVQTSSLLASRVGPVIRLASPRPYVALGAQVWGLTASPGDPDTAADTGR